MNGDPKTSKVIPSYEACPRERPECEQTDRVHAARQKAWTDARLRCLLKLYGVEEGAPVRDKPLLKRIEDAVAYLFKRKSRRGGMRRKRSAKNAIEPAQAEPVRPAYLWHTGGNT